MSELKRAVSTQVKIKVIRAIESGIRMEHYQSRPFAPLHRMVAGGRVGPLHQYHDHVSRGQKGLKLPRRRVDFSCLSEFILFFYGFAIKFVGLWLK